MSLWFPCWRGLLVHVIIVIFLANILFKLEVLCRFYQVTRIISRPRRGFDHKWCLLQAQTWAVSIASWWRRRSLLFFICSMGKCIQINYFISFCRQDLIFRRNCSFSIKLWIFGCYMTETIWVYIVAHISSIFPINWRSTSNHPVFMFFHQFESYTLNYFTLIRI